MIWKPSDGDIDRAVGGFRSGRLRRLLELAGQKGFLTPSKAADLEARGVTEADLLEKSLLAPEQVAALLNELDLRETQPGMPPGVGHEPTSRTWDHYLLVEEIGHGAMGRIWKAWDLQLRRWVALKILKNEAAPKQLRDRFLQEARAAAHVHHANLVTVHDVGEHQGSPFLVMELIPGEPLDVLEPTDRVVEILRKAAVALHEAHRQGVIHRDLKPGNILVGSDGEPHVVDFGLAQIEDPERRLTRDGVSLGTPIYMAPEQVLGKLGQIGAPTDVYALGVILYEHLAGRPPHHAATVPELFDKILNREATLPPGPAELAAIAMKAIEKSPGDRYASATAFAEDLSRFQRGDPVAARRSGVVFHVAKKMARNRVLLAAAVVVLAAMAFVVALRKGDDRKIREGKLARDREVQDQALRDRTKQDLEARLKPLQGAIHEFPLAFYLPGREVEELLMKLSMSLVDIEPLAETSDDPELLAVLGIGWQIAGDSPRAERYLLRAQKGPPENPKVDFHLGMLHFENALLSLIVPPWESDAAAKAVSRKLFEKAEACMKRIPTNWRPEVATDLNVARIYSLLLAGASDAEVIAQCDKGLAEAGGRTMGTEEYHVVKGWLKIRILRGLPFSTEYTENAKVAAETFSEAIKIRPHFPRGLFFRGYAWLYAAQFKESLADFKAAERLNDRFGWANVGQGLIYLGSKKFKEAIDNFSKASALDPSWALPLQLRGGTKKYVKDLQGGIEDLTESIRLSPDSPVGFRLRGEMKIQTGDLDGAVSDFTEAIRVADQAEAWLGRALVLGRQEKWAAAIKDLETALTKPFWSPKEKADTEMQLKLFREKLAGPPK